MTRTIMIVDDSRTMRGVLELNLKNLPNVRIVQAEDGVDALRKLDVEPPSLILIDINMPNMDGYELITAIRVGKGNKTLPIVCITTRGSDADRDKGLALGADAYVSKPINGAELRESVERLLK